MPPTGRPCYGWPMRRWWFHAWWVTALAACGQLPLREAPATLPGGGYVSFAHYGTHPVIDTEEQALVRLGLSADTASWALVHHYIEGGRLPPPEAVRVEDCVAAMAPAPRAGEALELAVTLGPSPFRAGWHALVIAVPAARREGPTRTLTVVSEAPDGVLERALAERGASIVPGDVRALPEALASSNDVLLVGDGAGLGGPDSQGALLAQVAARRAQGATLSVVARLGPGMDDALLDQLAMAGGGTHDVLIGGEERHLASRLTRPIGLGHVVASVRFDPSRVTRWRLVGHESRVAGPAVRPRGGLVPSGGGVYLMFEVKLAPGDGALGTAHVSADEGEVTAPLAGLAPSEAHRAVVAIASFAEKLRGSFWARDITWEAIEREVAALDAKALRDELGELVRRARTMWSEGTGLERPVRATRWLP